MSNDSDEPKTFRNAACYERLRSSFGGPILDGAKVYASKADVPTEHKKFAVVAPPGGNEGILMSELFATVASSCQNGAITGRNVLGKVKV